MFAFFGALRIYYTHHAKSIWAFNYTTLATRRAHSVTSDCVFCCTSPFSSLFESRLFFEGCCFPQVLQWFLILSLVQWFCPVLEVRRPHNVQDGPTDCNWQQRILHHGGLQTKSVDFHQVLLSVLTSPLVTMFATQQNIDCILGIWSTFVKTVDLY